MNELGPDIVCWNAGVMPNYTNLFVLCFLTKRIVSSALVFSAVALVRQGYQGGEVRYTTLLRGFYW